MVNDENFYVVQGWMINELQLKSTELQIFAIIYGFSQDGRSEFRGSLSYLQEWTGVSRPTVISTINSLIEKNLIEKSVSDNGETNSYKVKGSKESLLASKKSLLVGSKESLHYNNTNNNIYIDSVSDDLTSSSSTETRSSKKSPFLDKKSSGKLLSSQNTRKSKTQKVNSFIQMCEKESNIRGYSDRVQKELQKFFIMLGESGTLLPQVTIKEQLNVLDNLSEENKVQAIKGTIQHGWKSLVYMCDELSGKNSKKGDPAFIGNSQPKDMNAVYLSREESLRIAVENGEEVF